MRMSFEEKEDGSLHLGPERSEDYDYVIRLTYPCLPCGNVITKSARTLLAGKVIKRNATTGV